MPEEVGDFLQRMRTMSDLRDSQDTQRVKKLEEDLLKSRSERLARRAERARSLSPDKPTTPQSSTTADAVQEAASRTPTPAMEPEQLLRDDEPKKPAPNAAALSRSGTLSWQQRRPQSASLRRPLSLASPSADAPPVSSPESSPEPAPSRDSIAQSLGAKDPSWFKQTSDRGIGSAAYRRSQDSDPSAATSPSGRRQLPGMSRESTNEPDATSPPPESVRSAGSSRGSAILSNRLSTTATSDSDPSKRVRSPLPVLEAQKFAPPSEHESAVDDGDNDRTSARALAMSPTQGRISPERERSTSPTKGMGGFVQSAMLKRSDSVSKRWSTQAPPSPSRQNSTLSNRASMYGSTLSKPETRPATLSRDNSMEPSSRPGSSSNNRPMSRDSRDAADRTSGEEFVKPARPRHSRSKSVASTFSDSTRQHDEPSASSPSKRWSPTKSSWLESALSKPESPKMKQAPPLQPAWMSELSRIKQQRGSVDLGKGNPLQSPSADSPVSGRTSPLKDVQLRPVSLRRPESPKKEEQPLDSDLTKPAQPSPKTKPALSPKPSLAAKPEPNAEETPNDNEVSSAPEEATPEITSRPLSSTARFSKDSPISPAAAKPKPETPVKKDFRASLRSRNIDADDSKKNEVSELQSVFGKLKKTETKNYVAPDTFKDNIMRGKRGLSVTGGPRPYVHRDEFRDSLVSKKTAMLAKAQEEGSALKRTDSSAKSAPTPEALAMRRNLGRSDSISKAPPPPKEREREATPEALAKIQSMRASKPVVPEKPVLPESSPVSKEPAKPNKFADRFNPGLAGLLARGPPPMATNPGSSGGNATTQSPSEEKPGPAPELTHMTKGRARGPKRRTPTSKQATKPSDVPAKTETATEAIVEKVAPAGAVPLVKAEHVLPSSRPGSYKTNNTPEDPPTTRTPARDSLKAKPQTPVKSPQLVQKIEKSPTPEPPKKPASLELENKPSPSISMTPKKSPLAARLHSPQPSPSQSPSWATRRQGSSPNSPDKPVPKALQEISPPNSGSSQKKDETPAAEKTPFSVRNVSASWGRRSTASSPASTPVKSPIKLPTKADEEAAMENAGLRQNPGTLDTLQQRTQTPKPKPVGLGLGGMGLGGAVPSKLRESSPPKPFSAKPSPISPPVTSERPQSEPFRASPAPDKPQGLFDEFFDEPPVTTGQLPDNIDTYHILQNPPFDLKPSGKIRTLRKQIHEVTGDGKLISIPVQEEHILYQDSMYLCIHTFGDSKGARVTDAYLWSGDDVPESVVDDVQVFARNHAKQNQAKLVHMRQGKETPNFFDALGGIVITRRARPAPKEYMLCGRRHLGHVAFDEVDYNLKSLCSGYAFIISTQSDQVYLWKGRGCSQEELSAARLMGMDLAPTGEMNLEIDEGSESQDFISLFPPAEGKGPAIPRSADHWRYKATADRYRPRLFRFEQQQSSGWASLQTPATPKSPPSTTKVVEVMPFCQRDLEPEHIYVLDAFFETYIIVGSLARSQAAAFSTALMFVQEYTMLAVSEEDRPFMPISTIVLEGTPRDMKAVFRFWSDTKIPAAGLMSGKLGRGKSLRIVGLEKAIEATRR
ncbi:unnamed protein product [Periconia digitata]|uniref:DUF4045 domain-containing protein n=1 Tax=Periconia digitata TaxID=1303443 RepID=A0A9W4XLJ8_9PLEO|nr:unnamed protein product [Periconia digitata]